MLSSQPESKIIVGEKIKTNKILQAVGRTLNEHKKIIASRISLLRNVHV